MKNKKLVCVNFSLEQKSGEGDMNSSPSSADEQPPGGAPMDLSSVSPPTGVAAAVKVFVGGLSWETNAEIGADISSDMEASGTPSSSPRDSR